MTFRQFISKELKQWGLAGFLVLLTLSATTQWNPAKDKPQADSQQKKAAATKHNQQTKEIRAHRYDSPRLTAETDFNRNIDQLSVLVENDVNDNRGIW